MKITFIGSGAMGCLFGALLTEAGQEVQLFDIWQEHVDVLRGKGLTITREGTERTVTVQATTDPESIARTDLAVIFVKHAHTVQAAQTALQLCGDRGYVLTLQNGMGNAEIISGIIGPGRVICGTTAQGAMMLGPGRIQHSGAGKTILGMWDQEPCPVVEELASIFSRAGIETETRDTILPVLWNKLFANVGINAITALTNTRNGQLLDQEPTRQLVEDVVNEAVMVARHLDIEVAADALENVFSIARATASNRSSMGQDIDANRATEIEAINGYIVRQARTLDLPVPVNTALTQLIQTLQAHY